jgi:hypothetical protein
MSIPNPPYVVWRDGRPRAKHGPAQRARGFVDADLRHPDGRWFTLEEAYAFSDQRVREIAADRERKLAGKRPPKKRELVCHLIEDWLKACDAKVARGDMKPATRDSYRKAASALLWRPEERSEAKERRAKERAAALLGTVAPKREGEPWAQTRVTAIGKPELRQFFDYARAARGHHMALAMIAAFSAAWSWGKESTLWRLPANPRDGMEFERPDGRIVLVPMAAFTALVGAADALGRPSVGDCLYLALFTGQRQTDRLVMPWSDGGNLGRLTFRQSKTDQWVDLKEAEQLSARLRAAWKRQAELKLRLRLEAMPTTIVADERTGAPYSDTTYRNAFELVRDTALRGSAELGLPPCAEIEVLVNGERELIHDQDFRDTCVMLLDRAGCDLLTICDITGHSYQSAQTIVRHYRARNAARADTGIDRLVLQVRKEGMLWIEHGADAGLAHDGAHEQQDSDQMNEPDR